MKHDARGQRYFAKSHSQNLKAMRTDSLKLKKPMSKVAQKQAPAPTELEMQRKEKKYRLYIERNLSRISNCRGSFAARMDILGKEIEKFLKAWHALTHEQKFNMYLNARYIIQTINVHTTANSVKQAGSLPFMQLQGDSNHCGVCAFNNLVGQEVTTVHEMNVAADELWLRQFEILGLSITDDVQRHRDSNGFHSLDTMLAIASIHGLVFSHLICEYSPY